MRDILLFLFLKNNMTFSLENLTKTIRAQKSEWFFINPRAHGKAPTANRSGQWRYRIGDYRVIADIQDDKIIISGVLFFYFSYTSLRCPTVIAKIINSLSLIKQINR